MAVGVVSDLREATVISTTVCGTDFGRQGKRRRLCKLWFAEDVGLFKVLSVQVFTAHSLKHFPSWASD